MVSAKLVRGEVVNPPPNPLNCKRKEEEEEEKQPILNSKHNLELKYLGLKYSESLLDFLSLVFFGGGNPFS